MIHSGFDLIFVCDVVQIFLHFLHWVDLGKILKLIFTYGVPKIFTTFCVYSYMPSHFPASFKVSCFC